MSQQSKNQARDALEAFVDWKKHNINNRNVMLGFPIGKDKALIEHFNKIDNSFDAAINYLNSRLKENG